MLALVSVGSWLVSGLLLVLGLSPCEREWLAVAPDRITVNLIVIAAVAAVISFAVSVSVGRWLRRSGARTLGQVVATGAIAIGGWVPPLLSAGFTVYDFSFGACSAWNSPLGIGWVLVMLVSGSAFLWFVAREARTRDPKTDDR
jgi:hypothetical protein